MAVAGGDLRPYRERMPQNDPVLNALDEVIIALRENTARNEKVLTRAETLRRRRFADEMWSELVSEEERPLIVELLTQNMQALATAGSRLRRLEAKALHDEGMTMDRIASMFGVTRQRISELLRDA